LRSKWAAGKAPGGRISRAIRNRTRGRGTRSSRIDSDMLVARASKNSQLTPRPRGERHAYFGDRALGPSLDFAVFAKMMI